MKAIELYKNGNKVIFLAALKFSELKNIIRFTKKSNSNWANEESLNEAIDENDDLGLYYQRPVNKDRVNGLKKYISDNLLKENSDVLFPSSMILSMELYSEINNTVDGIVDIPLPQEKNSCLIVDGQHRIKGFISLYEELERKNDQKNMEILDNYKFNCSLLINYDLWEQARIFVNVNFNQKPVDKTLYYDIFGELKDELRDDQKSNLYIAHELGKFLNTSDTSPIKGFVKNYTSKKGFVSQAFLMEVILKNFGARGTWNSVIDNYKSGGNQYKKLPNIYVGYFNSVKKAFKKYWPVGLEKSNATVLSKTTGMAALVRLLGHIDKQLKAGIYPGMEQQNLMDLSLNEITEIFDEIFSQETVIKNASFYFGPESKYAGSGSVGLQGDLFYKIAEDLGIPAR